MTLLNTHVQILPLLPSIKVISVVGPLPHMGALPHSTLPTQDNISYVADNFHLRSM